MHLRSGPPRDVIPATVMLELIVPAIVAWTFINAPDDASWWIETDDCTYFGCRIHERFVVNEHMVRLTFTFKTRRKR